MVGHLEAIRRWIRSHALLAAAGGVYVILGGWCAILSRDGVKVAGATIAFGIVLGARFAVRCVRQRRRADPAVPVPRERVTRRWPAWFVAGAIALLYFVICCHEGRLLLPQHATHDYFGADEEEWTSLEWTGSHKGSHPLTPLLLAPFSVVRLLSGHVRVASLAVALNAGLGAIGLLLCFQIFLRRTASLAAAAALTGLLAASMNLLFFGALPELRTLLLCSVAPTFLLLVVALEQQRVPFGWWLLAGVLAFGVTITNFVPTLLCFGAALIIAQRSDRFATWLEFGGAVFVVVVALSLVQRMLFPETHYFFLPRTVTYEQYWVSGQVAQEPFVVVADLLRNFLVFSYVGPAPHVGPWEYDPAITHVSYANVGFTFGAIGWVAAAGLLLAMVAGAVAGFRRRSRDGVFLAALVLCLLFHFALHAFYGGKIRFLYVSSLTLPVVLLFAEPQLLRRRFAPVVVGVVALLALVNNLDVLHELTSR